MHYNYGVEWCQTLPDTRVFSLFQAGHGLSFIGALPKTGIKW